VKSFIREAVIILGSISLAWQVGFLILYLSTLLPAFGEDIADIIMIGAAVCGFIGALTCYFPYLLRNRVSWLHKREGLSVALSFVVLFFSLGIVILVLGAFWIGSM
jgi:hypothetical protein